MSLREESVAFVQTLFHLYLEERDFDAFLKQMSPSITWIGTGVHEICLNYQQAVKLIEAERDSWNGKFRILEAWYESTVLSDTQCLVVGEIQIQENGMNPILMEMHTRLSLLCTRVGDHFQVEHAHFSLPSVDQEEDEFVHEALVTAYNQKLAQKLEERTHLLQEKTDAMEALIATIPGGVIVCHLDADYTFSYVNEGFFTLTGYSREEVREKFHDSHLRMLTPGVFEGMRESFTQQLETTGQFTNEYPLVRKDGTKIWILEKGSRIISANGEQFLQSVMMDITRKKKQEQQLRERNEALAISEKRYEIATQQSGATLYDYIMETDEMLFPLNLSERFHLPRKLEQAMESPIWKRAIHPGSLERFYEMHQKMCEGEPSVRDTIIGVDAEGNEIWYEVILTCIFDEQGKPVRAVGLLNDITELSKLEKENLYRQAMTADKQMAFEANITRNTVTDIGRYWVKDLDVPPFGVYTDLIDYMIDQLVHPEDQQAVRAFHCRSTLIEAVIRGEVRFTIQYRRRMPDGDYVWIQNDLTGICDEISGDVLVRCYTSDISKQKEKEDKLAEEQHLYELMLARSTTVYEANLTQDRIVRGHENWYSRFGIRPTGSYTDLLRTIAARVVCAHDAPEFLQIFDRINALATYEKGEREHYFEYRQVKEDGLFWVSSTMHVFKDQETGDIKCYSYIQDINEKKLKQLELIYRAEHDQLTGVYNKTKTGQAIDDLLSSDEGKKGRHVFFIFDLDHFKDVNDSLGHAMGDVVLSRTIAKARALFRDDDIIGRIGGDEFVIFMKNVSDKNLLQARSEALCEQVRDTYTKNGERFSVSVSVGIALYPMHGRNYQTLYGNSDVALYTAKERGRNQYAIYDPDMKATPQRQKEIDVSDLLEARSFERNVSEYIFRVLYETPDKAAAIQSVLEVTGKQYGVSRAYIFEDNEDGLSTSNTHEWCGEGIPPQIQNLQAIPYSELDNYKDNFNELGIFYLPDLNMATPSVKRILEPQAIKGMIQFAIQKDDRFGGFVGFDFCDRVREPSKAEITVLKMVANMLGVFLTEKRALETAQKMRSVALSIVDALDSYAYIIRRDTYELLFINQKTRTFTPVVEVGDLCYHAFWHQDAPCAQCPMSGMTEAMDSKCTLDLKNDYLGAYTRATATWIDWTDGTRACLMDCVDISDFFKEKNN